MGAVFAHAVRHIVQAGETPASGRVVLSELSRGESPIYCSTPCVKYVLDGVEKYEVDGSIQTVRPGQFLLVDAGVRLRAFLPQRDMTTGLCIYLPATGVTPFIALDSARPGLGERDCDPFAARTLLLSASTAPWGRHLAKVAALLASNPDAGPQVADRITRVASRAVSDTLRDASAGLGRLSAEKPSTRRDLLHRVERVRSYLHDHRLGMVKLDALALHAGMSQFHLARTFRAIHGEPIAGYHRRLKLEHSARLMASGAMSPSQVATHVGFSDPAAFSRAFKRHFGVAPGAMQVRRAA